jgi:hypothetical protein
MSKRNVEVKALVILLLLASSLSAQVAEQKGELHLYHRATQIGTTAIREVKDDRGRVFKAIYYTGGGGMEGPYLEELLREQSVHVYTYDDHDCRIRSESYEPGMKLTRTAEARCFDGTATPKLTTARDARNIKQVETRHTANGGTRTVLHFDSDGEKVIAIRGDTPTDVDLTHGWGEEVSGFASGIAANREKGLQEDLNISVTIKNISGRREGGVMVSHVKVELKDSAGRLVEPKATYKNQGNETTSEECGGGFGVPFVGRSQWLPGYALGEQYDRLAPGRYSITVTHCLSARRRLLISNTIYLEVEGKKNSR